MRMPSQPEFSLWLRCTASSCTSNERLRSASLSSFAAFAAALSRRVRSNAKDSLFTGPGCKGINLDTTYCDVAMPSQLCQLRAWIQETFEDCT